MIIIIAVLILVEITAFRCYSGTINSYIQELNIVYTPTKPAYKYYHWHWTDIYEYHVFRLSNKEEKIILQEAQNGNWSEMTTEHINKLDSMEHYEEFLDAEYKKHKCYICIYDNNNQKIITNSDFDSYYYTISRIVFLYDTETNKYYYVYQSM